MNAADPLTTADALVRRAAVRVTRLRDVALVVRGGLGGALAGVVLAALGWWLFEARPGLPLLALPFVGAVLVLALRRRQVGRAEAACTLDRAAGAEEAFLTATDEASAPVEWRRLVAETAVRRVAGGRLAELLPFEAPRGLAPLLVGFALLTALIVVPRMADEETPTAAIPVLVGGASGGTGGGGSTSSEAATPGERLAAAAEQVRERGLADKPVEAREDLPAVDEAELRELATALAEAGDDDAAAALAALDAGEREDAIDLLRRALGDDGSGTGGTGNGGGSPGVPSGGEARHGRPSGDATWALRYDRRVRDWFRYRDDPNRTRGAR